MRRLWVSLLFGDFEVDDFSEDLSLLFSEGDVIIMQLRVLLLERFYLKTRITLGFNDTVVVLDETL